MQSAEEKVKFLYFAIDLFRKKVIPVPVEEIERSDQKPDLAETFYVRDLDALKEILRNIHVR